MLLLVVVELPHRLKGLLLAGIVASKRVWLCRLVAKLLRKALVIKGLLREVLLLTWEVWSSTVVHGSLTESALLLEARSVVTKASKGLSVWHEAVRGLLEATTVHLSVLKGHLHLVATER